MMGSIKLNNPSWTTLIAKKPLTEKELTLLAGDIENFLMHKGITCNNITTR